MPVRVCITGGAGFLGSHVVDDLIAEGHEVSVIDSLVPQVHGNLRGTISGENAWPSWANPAAQYRCADVRDRVAVAAHLAQHRPQVVVHLAAEVGVGQAEYEIERYVDANVRGTAVLLEAILAANAQVDSAEDGVRRVIVAGSMSSYGEGMWVCPTHGPVRPSREAGQLIETPPRWDPRCPHAASPDGCATADHLQPIPIPEWSSLRPQGIYAATKRDQEELSLIVARSYGLSVAVARFFNCYGPRQAIGNPYTGVAAIFAGRCLAGKAPVVYEDGGQLRDFVHVSDVASAIRILAGPPTLRLALREWSREDRQGVYNVSTGLGTSILDVARIACDELGHGLVPEVPGIFRQGDVRGCLGDSRRLMGCGWAPKVRPEVGLRELMHLLADSPAPTTDLDAAHVELADRGLVVGVQEARAADQAPAPAEGGDGAWG